MFLPIMEEDYDDVYKNILHLLENFIYIKNFKFVNFSFKFKNIIDGDLKNVSINNLRSVCLNCIEVVKKKEVNWKRGDLQINY